MRERKRESERGVRERGRKVIRWRLGEIARAIASEWGTEKEGWVEKDRR